MDYQGLIQGSASYISEGIWRHTRVLIGAILVPGRRTVTAVRRIMELGAECQCQACHGVLNRAT